MALAVVQHSVQGMGATNICTCNYPTAPTAGNLLLTQGYLYTGTSTGQAWSIADTETNAYVKGPDQYTTNGLIHYVAFACIAKGGGDDVTLEWTDNVLAGDCIISEISGVTGTVVTFDGATQTATGVGTAITSPSFTPGNSNDFVVNALTSANAISGISTPWTPLDVTTGGTGSAWGWDTGTTSSISSNATNGASAGWDSIIYAIKVSAASGTPVGGFFF